MSDQRPVLLVGYGPLPGTGNEWVPGVARRTWQFLAGLTSHGLRTHCVVVQDESPRVQDRDQVEGRWLTHDEELADVRRLRAPPTPRSLASLIEEIQPSSVVGATVHGSYWLARARPRVPFWADQFGHAMAEAQAKAINDRSDRILAYFYRRVRAIAGVADRYSVVSAPQRYAAIGELGAFGRLNRKLGATELVHVVPCCVPRGELGPAISPLVRTRVAEDAFVVLWSGSFNVWSDVETFFEGVTRAMAEHERIVCVVTGGEVAGQDRITAGRFQELVRTSGFEERFLIEGWVESELLDGYLAATDLAVVLEKPLYEGALGSKNRVLEWLGLAVPFVMNAYGELGEVIAQREWGATTPIGDAEALKNEIVKALRHPEEARQRARRARREAIQEFSPHATTRALAAWCKEPRRAPDREAINGALMSTNLARHEPAWRRLAHAVRSLTGLG